MSENIYKFVEQPKAEESRKGAMFRSKYDPNGPLIGSTFCMEGTTAVDGKGFHSLKKTHVVTSSMGLQPKKSVPAQFLRKGTRKDKDKALLPSVEQHNRNKEVIKPPVPSRDEKPVQGHTTSKDYVNCNAMEIINSSPKRKEAAVLFNKLEDYGIVPAYLEAVKDKIKQEKALVDTYVAGKLGPLKGACQKQQVMDEQERSQLINKLKQRWGEVNTEYQKYCHKVSLDTPGEIKRKASQEAELKQLEEDILKLSQPGPLVVVDVQD